MSTAIQSIVVNELTDKRVLLNNSSFARKINIGNNWSTIRIGFRRTITDVGFSFGGNQYFVGMMSDPSAEVANGPAGDTTKHFVGLRSTVGTAWSRVASPSAHFTVSGLFIRKVGTGVTSAAGGWGSRFSAVPAVRVIQILTITKGGSEVSAYANHASSASAGLEAMTDIDDIEILKAAMEIPHSAGASEINTYLNTVIGASGNAYTSNSWSPISADEADGDLNAVVVSWNRTITPMIFSEILWAKMA